MRVATLSKDRFHLLELFTLLALPNFINRLLINVYCVDLAFSAHSRGQAKCEIAETAADVRHAMPGLHGQCVKDFGGPLPSITSAVAF